MERLSVPALLCLLALIRPAPPDVLNWHEHGPAVLYDRLEFAAYDIGDTTGHSYYVGGPGGIWHTSDLAHSWRALSHDGLDNLLIAGLAIAAQAPEVLYAATGFHATNVARSYDPVPPFNWYAPPGGGVYRSDDRGETWRRLPVPEHAALYHSVPAVAASPSGDTVVVATIRQILRSLDQGQTWTQTAALPVAYTYECTGVGYRDECGGPYHPMMPEYAELVYHPHDFNTLVALTRWSGAGGYSPETYHALVSRDAGGSWDTLMIDGQHVRNVHLGGRIHEWGHERAEWRLQFAPSADSVIWAARRDGYDIGMVYRSEDYGESWISMPVESQALRKAPAHSSTRGVGIHPLSADTLVIDGTLFAYANGRLSKAKNDRGFGVDFIDRGPLLPAYEPEAALRFRVVSNYLSVQTVKRNPFGNYTYSSGPSPVQFNNAQIFDVCRQPPAFGEEHRLLATSASKAQWDPLVYHRYWNVDDIKWGRYMDQHTRQTVCHATNPYLKLVRSVPSTGSKDNGYIRSRARYAWQPEETQHIGSAVWALANSPAAPDVVYASALDAVDPRSNVEYTPGLWRSEDFGLTWTRMEPPRNQWGAIYPQLLHASAADSNLVFADFHRSRDEGRTWDPPPQGYAYDCSFIPRPWCLGDEPPVPEGKDFRRYRTSVVSHASDPSALWSCGVDGVLRWDNYYSRITPLASRADIGSCNDLAVMPQDTTWIWAATQTGLWETRDGGETWQHRPRGLPPLPVTAIDISHGYVTVATFGRGIFSVPMAELEAHITSSEPVSKAVSNQPFALQPNWPNPFRRQTTVQFSADEPATVRLDIYDVTGRLVTTLTNRRYNAGTHRVRWQAAGQARGVYFVRLLVNGQVAESRMMTVR